MIVAPQTARVVATLINTMPATCLNFIMYNFISFCGQRFFVKLHAHRHVKVTLGKNLRYYHPFSLTNYLLRLFVDGSLIKFTKEILACKLTFIQSGPAKISWCPFRRHSPKVQVADSSQREAIAGRQHIGGFRRFPLKNCS